MPMIAKLQDVVDNSYDYVVIGGGTTGLCVASKLAEDPSISVLVLEAGEALHSDPAVLIPGQYVSKLGNPKYDWTFKTVKQRNAGNREFIWPLGKSLGGSSAINGMLWNRPAKFDIDAFERLGNPGWNWETFDKNVKKVERFTGATSNVDREILTYEESLHGTSGPIVTGFPGVISGVESPFQRVLENLGIPRITDQADGYVKGYGSFAVPSTIDTGTYTRSYSGNAFLDRTKNSRKNLSVLTAAHCTEIVTDRLSDGHIVATAVKFICEGSTAVVTVKREVILSAGAINSPKLLELSGIGEKEVLQKAGVELKLELPGVGNNLQDHWYIGLSYELKGEISSDIQTFDSMRNPKFAGEQLALHADKKGLNTMAILGMAFAPLHALTDKADEIIQEIRYAVDEGTQSAKYSDALLKQYAIQLEKLTSKQPGCELGVFPGFLSFPNPPQPEKKYLTITPAFNHPFSRGSTHIISNDPAQQPAIDPAVFKEEADLTVMMETLKFARKMVKESPLADIITGNEVNPGPNVETDEQIRDYLRSFVRTTFHSCASLAMLPREDGGVVDHNLKVYGTANIRVADLSIVPLHIGGHPLTLAYAIGEQAGEIINKSRANTKSHI